jgi:hypothetical protein
VLLPGHELSLVPGLVGGIQPLEKGGVHTVTTVEIHHAELFPHGVFEYQHSTGDEVQASLCRGLDEWVRVDLVPILDALREQPTNSTTMVTTFPATEHATALKRRAVLGPVAYWAAESEPDRGDAASEEHAPFCSCCFLTRCYEAFEDLLRANDTFAIRFYALRKPGAAPGADCRVNGIDHERGAEALRRYALTWPERGFEFRKQYVVVHSLA